MSTRPVTDGPGDLWPKYNGCAIDPDLTAEQVRRVLSYDPDSGTFGRVNPNDKRPVGTALAKGYIRVGVLGKRVMAHRLAWLLVHGAWPDDQIDHINGNPADNRIGNLRCVPGAINNQNLRRAYASNKSSGLLGVVQAERGKWRAVIQVNGKKHRLGRFATPEQAHEKYLEAKRQLHAGNTL